MSMGAPPSGGMEEYQRLMAERAAAESRKRKIYGVVLLAALGGGGFWLKQQKDKAKAAQGVLEAGGRFAEKDKSEMGPFWNCVFGSETDVGMMNSADQIQKRIEGAYFTQQKTFSEHITTECIPKLEGAKSAMAALVPDMPSELKPPLEKYVGALPRMVTGLEVYAEKIKGRGAVKDVDASIQEVGGAFSAEVTPASVAFEKFMVCAIPDLDKKKDIQAVLEYLAETCKTGAVEFMTTVREKCGSLVTGVDNDAKPAPSKTFKANTKKFEDSDQRQLQAWDYCGRRSRKGTKKLDLEEFLTAAGDYMEARGELVQAARETAAKIQGQPLPETKKKAPGAPAGE